MIPPRVPFRVAAYVALGFLVLHLFNLWTDHGSAYADVTHHSEAVLKLGARLQAEADSLRRIEAQAEALLAVLHAKDSALLRRLPADSLLLNDARTVRDSVIALGKEAADMREALGACEQELVIVSAALHACGQRAHLLAARLDTVTNALQQQVHVSPPRCGAQATAGLTYTGKVGVGGTIGYGCRL